MHPLARRHLIPAALAGGLLLLSVAPASAVSIDFHVAPLTGGILYPGGANPLMGSGIGIDTVTGNGTPDHAGSFDCFGCELNFTTGGNVLAGPPTWVFGNGGINLITISGVLDANGSHAADAGDIPIVMVGDFVGPSITVDVGAPGYFGISVGLFLDFQNPAVTDFFGLPSFPPPYVGTLALSWLGSSGNDGELAAIPLGGMVRNYPLAPEVPEPASMLLFGAGLLGVAGARRRAARD